MTRIIRSVEQAKGYKPQRANKVARYFSFGRNIFRARPETYLAIFRYIWNVFQTSLSHLHFCLYCCLAERTPFIATSEHKHYRNTSGITMLAKRSPGFDLKINNSCFNNNKPTCLKKTSHTYYHLSIIPSNPSRTNSQQRIKEWLVLWSRRLRWCKQWIKQKYQRLPGVPLRHLPNWARMKQWFIATSCVDCNALRWKLEEDRTEAGLHTTD